MRIGEFAQKHNTTIDTIRHYLDLGLLVSEKQGGQYRFTKDDSWDLNKIMELKEFDFSLSEVREVLTFHRLAGELNPEYRKNYLDLLKSKKVFFNKEIERLKELGLSISDKIIEYELSNDSLIKLGLPVSSIDLLQCPKCSRRLEVFNGKLEKNMIISGVIKCECGFNARIDNGIYIDENDVKEKTLFGNKMPTKKEYLEMASTKYINFYYNGMAKSIDYINKCGEEPRYILELDSCVGSFLMQYIDDLPKNATYILNCHDLERISAAKANVELHYKHSNFIFLCCDPSNLPIGKETLDLVVDHGKTSEFFRYHKKELPNIYSQFLKEKGLLVGTYRFIDNKSKDFKTLPVDLKDRYNRDRIVERLESAGFKEIESLNIGPVIEDNPLSMDTSHKELYMAIYLGEKV